MSASTKHVAEAKPQVPRLLPSFSTASTGLVSRKRKTIVPNRSTGKPKKRRLKQQTFIGPDIDSNTGLNLALGRLDRYLLADCLSQKTYQYVNSMISIEIEEKRIPGMYKL